MKRCFEGESASEVRFFHVCTDGTNNGIIHFSDKDYNQAIKVSAICAHKAKVDIICYCHMSTHSHWAIASPSFEQAKEFADEYKRNYARYAYLEHREHKIFKDIDCVPKEITTIIYLRNCICYILLNPVAAGIVKSPEFYKWSSFSAYFSDLIPYQTCSESEMFLSRKQGNVIYVKDLGTNECRRLLNTRANLTDSGLMVNPDGTIVPWSLVDYKLVESLFRNRTEFYRSLALTNSSVEEARYVIKRNKYSDTEVMAECFELSKRLLNKESIQWLTREEKYRLVPHIRKKTAASPNQIARILRLKSDEVSTLLGSIN